MQLKTKYYKKDILIIGFGKTGKSILKFFKNQKVNIFIYDDNLDIIKNGIELFRQNNCDILTNGKIRIIYPIANDEKKNSDPFSIKDFNDNK